MSPKGSNYAVAQQMPNITGIECHESQRFIVEESPKIDPHRKALRMILRLERRHLVEIMLHL